MPSILPFSPGTKNPADLETRGISAEEGINSLCWLNGPTFIQEASSCNSDEFSVSDSSDNVIFLDEAIKKYCSSL